MTSCAAFIKESRMNFVEPIALNRKSGGVEGSAVLLCPRYAGARGTQRFAYKQIWPMAPNTRSSLEGHLGFRQHLSPIDNDRLS
jgi:hypothetical protein